MARKSEEDKIIKVDQPAEIGSKDLPKEDIYLKQDGTLMQIVVGIARAITALVKFVVFLLVLLFWASIGLAIYLAFLIQAFLLFTGLMSFKMLTNQDIRPDVRRFESAIEFWPHGMTILTRAFWTEMPIEAETLPTFSAPEPVRFPYVYATIQFLFTAVIIILGYWMWTGVNLFESIITQSNYTVVGLSSAAILLLLFLADLISRPRRKPPQNGPWAGTR